MVGPAFSARILEQGWLSDDAGDHCSHGKIELTMAGRVITVDDDDFGIIESALALLRTLDSDYDPERDVNLSDGLLLLHGCGIWLMVSCPLGITWRVEHTDSGVHMFGIERTAIGLPSVSRDIDFTVPYALYEAEVVAFAEEAKSLYDGVQKSGDWEFSRPDGGLGSYEEFWDEFDVRLQSHRI